MTNSDTILGYDTTPRPSFIRRLLATDLARGAWAMGDQAIVSLGNFATNMLLVRKLAEADLGAFGLVLEVILFLNSLQAAVIIYPLSLHGAKMDAGAFRRFANGCLLLTCLFALPLMLVSAGYGGVLGHSVTTGILAGCAMALWQVQEMLRRGLIAQMRYSAVVWGDAVSYLGQAALLFVYTRGVAQIDLPVVFAIMGITSAGAALVQLFQIGFEKISRSELKDLLARCWKSGRWALASAMSAIVTALSFNWTLGLSHGLDAVASFTVLSQLLKLSNPVISSISGLITPAVSREHARGNAASAVRKAMKFAAIGAAILTPYYAVLLSIPSLAIRFYAGKDSPYLTQTMAIGLRILVICYIGQFASYIVNAILNGLGQSKVGFYSQAMNAVITVVIALPLIVWLGLVGALVGGLISVFCWAILSTYMLVHYLRHDDGLSAVSH